ncbi:microtubule-associated protein futsch-like isoform X2 [Rhinatrema bivittatum]|uniref:microtubule-associated protein futsch-like isoform X2 n=1 Tax=Rhinatrema bivittatum TaxID=194408 RepID=UPI001127D3D4|nr:microtubule-associated protein futsch-like isoform X2 [Rhinatrema bivittatum]
MADRVDTEGDAPQGLISPEEEEASRPLDEDRKAADAAPVTPAPVAEAGQGTPDRGRENDRAETDEHPGVAENPFCKSQGSSAVSYSDPQVSKGAYAPEADSKALERISTERQLETEERPTEHRPCEPLEPDGQADRLMSPHAEEHQDAHSREERGETDQEAEKSLEEVSQYLTETETEAHSEPERGEGCLAMEESTPSQEAPPSVQCRSTTAESNPVVVQEPTADQELGAVRDDFTEHQDYAASQETPTASKDYPATTLLQRGLQIIQQDHTTSQEAPTEPMQDPTVADDPVISQDDLTAAQADPATSQDDNINVTEAESISLESIQHGNASFSPLPHSEGQDPTAPAITVKAPLPLDAEPSESSSSSSQHPLDIQGSCAVSHPSPEASVDHLLADFTGQGAQAAGQQDRREDVGEEPGQACRSCDRLHGSAEKAAGEAPVECCGDKGVGSADTKEEEPRSGEEEELKSTGEPTQKDGSKM